MDSYSAIVTGGAQGIGKAIAKALAARGMHIVIVDVDELACREAAAEISGAVRVSCVDGSAGDEAVVRRAVKEAEALGHGLYAAAANAGIALFKPLHELSLTEWQRVLTVNLTGAFLLAKHAASSLRRHRGAMVLTASTRALMSEPHTESYSASKGGVVALTHALAMSLAPDVRVNCVSPGWIDTSEWQRNGLRRKSKLSAADHAQHPVGRVGRPEDVAAMVAYLISPEAAFITGQNFVVDGGMTRKMIYV